MKVKVFVSQSCPLFATPRTVARQAPLSMEFSRQEYWSGLPFHSPGDLPNPWIKPRSSALQGDSLPSEPLGKKKVNFIKGIYPKNPLITSYLMVKDQTLSPYNKE